MLQLNDSGEVTLRDYTRSGHGSTLDRVDQGKPLVLVRSYARGDSKAGKFKVEASAEGGESVKSSKFRPKVCHYLNQLKKVGDSMLVARGSHDQKRFYSVTCIEIGGE